MKTTTRSNKKTILFALILFIICFSISFKQSLMQGTDLNIHNHEFLNISDIIGFKLTYPLYHLIVLMVLGLGEKIFPILMSVDIASAIVMGVIEVFVYLLVYKVLNGYDVKRTGFIAFLLCIVTAIWCPLYNINIYLGQSSPNTWHSPTNMMVKPFAILIYFLVVHLLDKIRINEKPNKKEYIILPLLFVISALAKPSFYQGFIPALFIYIVFALIYTKFKYVKQYFILGLCILPATGLILFQMFSSFFVEGDGSGEGIGIGWFLVPKIYSPSIIVSLFLLVCFPLFFTFAFKEHLKRLDLKMAWIYFIVSFFEYGLLYEKGERFAHGNFGWAYSLASFILFTVTTGLFFKHFNREKIKDKILFGLWMLHGLSGLAYLSILLFIPHVWL